MAMVIREVRFIFIKVLTLLYSKMTQYSMPHRAVCKFRGFDPAFGRRIGRLVLREV